MRVLIAFSYVKNGTSGMSNATVNGKAAIPSEDNLVKVKKQIKKFGQYDDVVILNWIPLMDGVI